MLNTPVCYCRFSTSLMDTSQSWLYCVTYSSYICTCIKQTRKPPINITRQYRPYHARLNQARGRVRASRVQSRKWSCPHPPLRTSEIPSYYARALRVKCLDIMVSWQHTLWTNSHQWSKPEVDPYHRSAKTLPKSYFHQKLITKLTLNEPAITPKQSCVFQDGDCELAEIPQFFWIHVQGNANTSY